MPPNRQLITLTHIYIVNNSYVSNVQLALLMDSLAALRYDHKLHFIVEKIIVIHN